MFYEVLSIVLSAPVSLCSNVLLVTTEGNQQAVAKQLTYSYAEYHSRGRIPHPPPRKDGCLGVEACGEVDVMTGTRSSGSWRR
jgi:hypothetical protein